MIKVYWESNENIDKVPDDSVKLVLTSPSPPSKEDHEDYKRYLQNFKKIASICRKKLKSDGYFVLVITDDYHKSALNTRHQQFIDIIRKSRFNLFDVKIWSRGKHVDIYRPPFSYIVFTSKRKTKKIDVLKRLRKPPIGYGIWEIASKRGYWVKNSAFPAPLAERIIHALTDEGDVVLDPYMGTGTSVIMADVLGRTGIGFEIDKDLKPVYLKRISELRKTPLNSEWF